MLVALRRTIILGICAVSILAFACSRSQPSSSAPNATPAVTSFKVDPQTAGEISGKIFFSGKKLPAKKVDMDEDPLCAKQHATPVMDEVIAANGSGQEMTLGNVFVYVKKGLEDKNFAPPADNVTIEQKGCWFGPRVLGIQVGQTLKVINSDPLTHNIHPLPQVNREWNQSQAPGAEAFERKFTQPEVMIRVKCNIHNWMHAWVGVVAHPYFVVTGADGSFTLRNLPPGTYTIEAWHEQLGRQEQQLTVAPAGKSESNFKFKGE